MFTVSAFSGKFSLSIALILLVFGLTAAQAQQLPPLYSPQQFSTSVGGGTLSWQAEGYPYVCPTVNGFSNPNNEGLMFSNLTFTYNGSTNPVLNTQLGSPYWCPYSSPSSYDFSVLPNGACTVTFSPELNGNAYVSVDSCSPGTPGYINPKYIVIGVVYSPPGSSSSVSYTNNSVVGSTATTSSSFNSSTTTSVSLLNSAGIPGFLSGKATATYSASYAQQSGSSNTVALSQTVSNQTGLTGYIDPTNGLNHNYDYIQVWLNPIAQYTVSVSGNSFNATFNGYGYDLTDTHVYNDMDVIGIPVGCLNGYFATNNPAWLPTCEDIASVYARTWAMNNTDGSGPGLTSTDLESILEADPFSTNYTPTLASGSYTTTDGRFTECYSTGCTQVIEFEPNWNYTYIQGYSTTTTNTQNYQHTETFAASQQYNSSVFLSNFSLTLQIQNQMTWQYSTSNAVNNSQGKTSTLTIKGPNPGYAGPLQFVQFQDNYFGTLMLFP